jgi:HK97 family phage portal protein
VRGLASLAVRQPEARAIQATAWGDWGGTGPTWAGVAVDAKNAHQLLTVYACARFIADGIATLPVDVFTGAGAGSREVTPPPWVEQPTVDLDRVAWTTQVLWSLLISGNCYLHVRRSGLAVSELIPIDPTLVAVHRDRGRKEYRINGRDAGALEILHIPAVMAPGCDVGMSPVEAARQSIGQGMAAQEYAARLFGSGMSLAGVIETPTSLPPPPAPGSAEGIAKAAMRRHGGKAKAHLPLVLEGGATWKQTEVTPEQAQFLQTRQYTAAEISSQMFLIDPTEFGLSMDKGSSITYSNLEQRNARKVTVTFLPWIVRLERAVSSLLAGRSYKFNVGGLLRGDTKTRWETYDLAERINKSAEERGDSPVLTTAEMRELENFGPAPGVSSDGSDSASGQRQLSVAEVVQKVYLGVGVVLTADEAREIVNKAGGDLPIPGPFGGGNDDDGT